MMFAPSENLANPVNEQYDRYMNLLFCTTVIL